MKRISTEQRCKHPVIKFNGKVVACNTPVDAILEGTTEVKCLGCHKTIIILPRYFNQNKSEGLFR